MSYFTKSGKDMTLEEIQRVGDTLINKTFRDLGDNLNDNKGGFGHFIEKNVFNYEPNSDSEPDFKTAKTELKVTPVRKLNSGKYVSKERLVLNIINYELEATKTFYTSSFWKKNAILYILFYLYDGKKEKLDFLILKSLLLEFEKLKNDLAIIKNDWQIIHNKIIEGKAHEISEADTLYLAACTKGANASSMRAQYNSDIPAKQRAYSLKNSYMTQIFNRSKIHESLNLMVDAIELEKQGFEKILTQRLTKFIGLSQDELKRMFNITSNAKNLNELLVSAMLGLKNTRVSKTEEFLKANIIPKTIRVENNNTIREHMSFETFEFTKIIEETWEDSSLKDHFESTKFMFVIFKNNGTDYIFKGIKFWNMPVFDIETDLRDVWEKTIEIIKSGNIVKEITHRRETNFPKPSDNRVSHVRPHAKDSQDEYPLPMMDRLTKKTSFTKQCFWLNKSYLLDIIRNII